MRLTLLALCVLVAAPLAGCKKVTKEQGTSAFHRELHRHFTNLNNEAQFRRDEFRKADVRLGMVTPTGSIYSTYTFDPAAFIVKNFKCRNCETKLILTSVATDYLCPSCGRSPHEVFKKEANYKSSLTSDGKPKEPNADAVTRESLERAGATVQPMFEFAQGKDNPNAVMVATVRYVRRQWAYDQRGVVDISPRVIEKASVDASWLPSDNPQMGRSPGFHRLDATFVGEIEFEFRGGEAEVKTRRAEEPVRPWKDMKGNQ